LYIGIFAYEHGTNYFQCQTDLTSLVSLPGLLRWSCWSYPCWTVGSGWTINNQSDTQSSSYCCHKPATKRAF